MASARPPAMRSPIEEMNRVLDRAPPLCTEILKDETRLTGRWLHGDIHDRTAPMSNLVVMTYYGAPQRIEWRNGRQRQQSLTRSGAITLIPSDHEAHWDVHGPIEVSHVYLPPARILACTEAARGPSGIEFLDRIGFMDPTASQLLEILAREVTNPVCSSRLMMEQIIDVLCLHLLRTHSSMARVTPEAQGKGLARWQVTKIHDYMRDHLDQEMGLDELAALLGLSRFHFCTAFRQATGLTPHRFLIAMRIARARELLLDPGKPVTEIAASIGYQTPSAFSTAFRAVEGISPSEFRRRI